jgi:hypothetical protein
MRSSVSANAEILAFWLRPAAREREFFATLIQELAARYDAPVFEPHVTLNVCAGKAESALDVLPTLTSRAPIRLEIARVVSSPEFTKTLFVQFRASDEAAQLSAEIERAAPSDTRYHFDPHLSLIYQAMATTEKEGLARTIVLPFQSVVFDSLQLIAAPAQITQRADVEAWRTLAERGLG